MASKIFAVVGILLFVFVCLAMPMVSASYISHVPLKTVFGVQIDTLFLEGHYPNLECVAISGDVFRDALLGIYGTDPYYNSIIFGFVKPYELFCGYDGKMVSISKNEGVCYLNGNGY